MDSLLLNNSSFHNPSLELSNKSNVEKIKELTKCFLHQKSTLLKVSQIFSDEIDLGLALKPSKKSSLIMANTFVTQLPNGSESGDYLSLDLGSTNFRVVLSKFRPNAKNEFEVKHYVVPQQFRRGQSTHLFNFFAECIADFVETYLPGNREPIPLGFTFSFPMIQKSLRVALLETWTKDFDCPDAVGRDAAQLLQEAIDRQKLNVILVVILNDATGTLVQGIHLDPTSAVGLILGTGSNACYIEKIDKVEKWADRQEWLNEGYKEVIIDMECGGFGDNGVIDFAKTVYDFALDKESLFPNSYTFEKLFGGKFLGDIVRRVLLDLAEKQLLFDGKVTKELKTLEVFTAEDVSHIESDKNDEIYKCLAKRLGYECWSSDDQKTVRYVCAVVCIRGALMLASILSNLIVRMSRPEVTIAIDGSLYKYHPKLHKLITDFIRELVPNNTKFKLILAEDGSGKGAGLVAAVAQRLTK